MIPCIATVIKRGQTHFTRTRKSLTDMVTGPT